MTKISDGLTLVAARVQSELDRRSWNPNDVYSRARVDPKTLQKVLDGEAIRSDSRQRLIVAFGWPEDAWDRIARGEDLDDEEPPPWSELLTAMRQVSEGLEHLARELDRRLPREGGRP